MYHLCSIKTKHIITLLLKMFVFLIKIELLEH